jgi:GNAT superfamily N-acetyltransferase
VNRTQIGGSRGGTTATIRRAHATDLAALGGFFAALSPQTRLLRFFAPVTPTGAMLARLSGGAGGTDVVVAIAGGVIIGHAMAVDRAGLHGDQLTDIGVVVADAWQGRGIGSALVRALITGARGRGVTSLTMDVLHGNHQVLAMIAAHWGTERTDYRADCVTVQVRLPRHHQERPHPACCARPPASRPPAPPGAQSPAGRSRALAGSRP